MPQKNTAALPFNEIDLQNKIVLFDRSQDVWLLFQNPVEIVSAYSLSEVKEKLERVENLTQYEGFHAAGFISYEAAPAFDSALRVNSNNRFPLLWFGTCRETVPVTLPEPESIDGESESDWTSSVSEAEYSRSIDRIKQYIAEGDTYQVNNTIQLRKRVNDNGFRLFMSLAQSQGNGCPAYINTGEYVICSASPELFFALDGDRIITRPMKGTAPRGRFIEEDREKAG